MARKRRSCAQAQQANSKGGKGGADILLFRKARSSSRPRQKSASMQFSDLSQVRIGSTLVTMAASTSPSTASRLDLLRSAMGGEKQFIEDFETVVYGVMGAFLRSKSPDNNFSQHRLEMKTKMSREMITATVHSHSRHVASHYSIGGRRKSTTKRMQILHWKTTKN